MSLWERLFGPKVPSMTPAELAEALREGRVVVLDIRAPRDFAEGHIPGARHVSPSTVTVAAADIPEDVPIVIVCRSGNRSVGAARALLRWGRSGVYSLRGGMRAWVQAGLPVEKAGP